MAELISVIVPIYKVEKYLPKCLDSIINQTYENLEIILVDDGSPDHCPEICDEYAKRDSRIKVIHQKNQGLSAARNSGLDEATGSYIGFVDSDDSIHKEMYERLYKNMKNNGTDIAVCKYCFASENGPDEMIELDHLEESVVIYNGQESFGNLYNDLVVPTVVAWNKLYKRELFDNLRYEVGKIHEDEYIIHYILDRADKIVYTNLPLYIYLPRDNSITGQTFNIKRLDFIEAIEQRLSFYAERGYAIYYEKEYLNYLNMLMTNYYLLKKHCSDEKFTLENLRSKFINVYKNQNGIKLPAASRIKYDIFCLNPALCHGVMQVRDLFVNRKDYVRSTKELQSSL